MHATTEVVCLEARREQRQERLLTALRGFEERVVEGESIAYERIEADLPELAKLRACHEGIRNALRDIGSGLGLLITDGVQIPTELMVAQEEIAGVGATLRELLSGDLVENRDHRAIVVVLRGGGEEGA